MLVLTKRLGHHSDIEKRRKSLKKRASIKEAYPLNFSCLPDNWRIHRFKSKAGHVVEFGHGHELDSNYTNRCHFCNLTSCSIARTVWILIESRVPILAKIAWAIIATWKREKLQTRWRLNNISLNYEGSRRLNEGVPDMIKISKYRKFDFKVFENYISVYFSNTCSN